MASCVAVERALYYGGHKNDLSNVEGERGS